MIMSEAKYYTPTIDEFHVGFEYEYKIGENVNWTHDVYDGTKISLKSLFNFCPIRVKHLDHDDIVSLGWELDKEDSIGPEYISIGDEGNWKLQQMFGESWVIMYLHTCRFKGNLRNKSELKRLMRQLNITQP